MRKGSMLFEWHKKAFKDQPMKVRAVAALIDNGHTGLAESAAVRSLISKYAPDLGEIEINRGIKVNYGDSVFYL